MFIIFIFFHFVSILQYRYHSRYGTCTYIFQVFQFASSYYLILACAVIFWWRYYYENFIISMIFPQKNLKIYQSFYLKSWKVHLCIQIFCNLLLKHLSMEGPMDFFLLINMKLIDLFWEIVIHVQNLFAYMLLCKVLHMKQITYTYFSSLIIL